MRKVIFIVSVLIGMLLIGCGQSKEKMLNEITEKEKPFFSNVPVTDTVKINEMVSLYTRFADKFSDDSLSPVFLYRAAGLQMNSGKNEAALTSLDKIIKDHSDFAKLPEAYFLKAFIYDNNIKNLKKAREAYLDFIQKFPDNELADDAQASIKNLGKTPEQIINEIQMKQKQKEDSLAAVAKK